MSVEALKSLAEKVEAGNAEAVRELIVNDAENFDPLWLGVGRIMEGSLDAAKALHEAVLPEWHFTISTEANGNGFYADVSDPKWSEVYTSCKDTAARAWLLAILKALIEQEESK